MCTQPYKLRAKNKNWYFVPCGTCYDCVKKRRASWTVRNLVEYEYSRVAYFVTLTYDDDKISLLDLEPQTDLYLPNRKHYQNFLKRVRKALAPARVRYFLCHEYGSNTFRPHYHVIFYLDEDIKLKNSFFRDKWMYGNTVTDRLNQSRIHYTSKYLQKSTYRHNMQKLSYLLHQGIYDYTRFTDELKRLIIYKHSFIRCSRSPAIGAQILKEKWFVDYVKNYAKTHGNYPNFNRFGANYPLPRYYIKEIFTEEERALYCQDYEHVYHKELKEEAEDFGCTPAELRKMYEDMSDRKIKNLEDVVNFKDLF